MLDDMGIFWICLAAGHLFCQNQTEARWRLSRWSYWMGLVKGKKPRPHLWTTIAHRYRTEALGNLIVRQMDQNVGFLMFFLWREIVLNKLLDCPDDLLAAWPLDRALGIASPVSSKGKQVPFPTKTLVMSSQKTLFVGDFACFFNELDSIQPGKS